MSEDNTITHHVGQYDLSAKRLATMSGMGRHKGTMDSAHSQRTAQRHAAALRKTDPTHRYVAEHIYAPALDAATLAKRFS